MKNVIKYKLLILVITTLSICNLIGDDFCYNLNKERDVIHLIGENHEHAECIRYKNFLKKEAKGENIILAMESISFAEIEDDVLGIEEYSLYQMFHAYEHYMYVCLYKIEQDLLALNKEFKIADKGIVDLSLIDPDLYNAFLDMCKVIKHPYDLNTLPSNHREILETIESLGIFQMYDILLKQKMDDLDFQCLDNDKRDAMISTSAKLKELKKIESMESKKPIFLRVHDNIFRWINLMKEVFKSYLQENYQKELLPSDMMHQGLEYLDQLCKYVEMNFEENPEAISNISEDYKLKFYPFWDKLVLSLRDRAFLKNIVNIFENNKWQQRPLYVIVGGHHVPFIYEELMKLGYKVELNDWIQIEYEENFIEDLINHKRAYDEEAVKNLIKLVFQSLKHERIEFQIASLSFLIELMEKKLIDKNVLNIQQLFPLLIEKLRHESFDIQNITIHLFSILINQKFIDQQIFNINELVKIVIEKLDHNDKDVRASALSLFKKIIEKKLIDKKTLIPYQFGKTIIEKLDNDHPDVQIHALRLLRIMMDEGIIDQRIVDTHDLVKRICSKLEIDPSGALFFIENLIENNSIDANIADTFQIGKRAIEKLNDTPMAALFVLGKLIENKLIDQRFIEVNELEKLALGMLTHDKLWVNIQALWLLSFLLEQEVLINLELAIKCIDSAYHLVISEEELSKYDVNILRHLVNKFLIHSDEKVKDVVNRINLLLNNRLQIEIE